MDKAGSHLQVTSKEMLINATFRDFPSWKSLCCNFCLHDIELRLVFTPGSRIRDHLILPYDNDRNQPVPLGARKPLPIINQGSGLR
jgi:hypothetical protein